MLQNKRRRDEGDFDYAEQEEEMLSRMIVKEHFKPLKRMREADAVHRHDRTVCPVVQRWMIISGDDERI